MAYPVRVARHVLSNLSTAVRRHPLQNQQCSYRVRPIHIRIDNSLEAVFRRWHCLLHVRGRYAESSPQSADCGGSKCDRFAALAEHSIFKTLGHDVEVPSRGLALANDQLAQLWMNAS